MKIICALTHNRVIGKDNKLLWHIPEDLKNFKRLTTGNTVIMGLKTFHSLGKPLPHRNNIVLSKEKIDIEGVDVCLNIPEAIAKAKEYGKEIFIIGGASIYAQFLPLVDTMYLSFVHQEHEGDAYFPEWSEDEWEEVEREKYEEFDFVVYRRR